MIENLALRQQLALFNRQRRPRLTMTDKLFWVFVGRFWSTWNEALILVTPETVVRWHRAGASALFSAVRRVLISIIVESYVQAHRTWLEQ